MIVCSLTIILSCLISRTKVNMEQLNEEFCALIHDANTNERNVLRFINHRPAYHIIAGVFKYYNFGHHDAYVFPEFALGKYIADYLLIGKALADMSLYLSSLNTLMEEQP